MGETDTFQPLTRQDKVTVILYRVGIVMTTIIITIIAIALLKIDSLQNITKNDSWLNPAIILLYISAGLSVFFIHLYVSAFHRTLKKVYYAAIAALAILFILGNGDILSAFANKTYSPLLLIPLSVCIGFITAKEAFCFKLTEGYILALTMPIYLLALSAKAVTMEIAAYWLLLIAVLLVIFTLRKISMPLHYDIGDKSAYN